MEPVAPDVDPRLNDLLVVPGRSLRRLLQEEAQPKDNSSASQAAGDSIFNQGDVELAGVELGDEDTPAARTSTEAQEDALSASLEQPEAAVVEPALELGTQVAQARGSDADESLTLVGDEPATNWAIGANSSDPTAHSQTAVDSEGILSSADVSDLSLNESSSHSTGNTSEEHLEGLASSQLTASNETEDPLIQFPISGSDLPALESSNATAELSLATINGSLQAAITESETASNVTAGNSETSTSRSSGASELLDTAVNATGLSNSSSRPGNLTELLEEVSHCQATVSLQC